MTFAEIDRIVIVEENSFNCLENVCSFRADQGVEKVDKYGNSYQFKYPNSGLFFEIEFIQGEDFPGQQWPSVRLISVEK